MRAPLAAFVVLVAAVVLSSGLAYSLLSRPPSFSNPVANITVTLPSGTSYRQLTTGTWNDRYPAWSPNGKSIAYISDKGGLQALWIMDASGLHQRQMSDGCELAAYPSWSPDSSKIAFWALNAQSAEFRVVHLSDNSTITVHGSTTNAIKGEAAWSPDGTRLAFFTAGGATQLMVYDFKSGAFAAVAGANGSLFSASWATNDRIVYSSNLGGRDQLLQANLVTNQSGVLLGGGADFVAPSVGPNGSLAYFSNLSPGTGSQLAPGYGTYNVWISEADGSNATFQFNIILAHQGSIETEMVPYVPGVMVMTSPPAWSPAGNEVAYTASGTIFTQLFIWDVSRWTTSCVGPIQAGVYSQQPTWSADGVNVAFSCNLSGTYHIWVVPAAGGTGGQVPAGY